MICHDVREILPEVAGGELDGAVADEARAHAASCASCRQALDELSATVALSRKLGATPLPEGFALELHRQLVEAGAPPLSLAERVRRAIAARPLLAMLGAATAAASLAVLISAEARRPSVVASAPAPVESLAEARLPRAKVALVKIDFVAAEAVDDVEFEVMLPDGLRFFSKGQELAERSFRWHGRLGAGSNPLPVAVKGERPGRYRVVAHAVGDGVDVTHEVVLEVTT